MTGRSQKLADLHLHLYGSLHWQDYLEFVKERPVDWSSYEEYYREVYGERPAIREILKQCRAANPGADEAFRRLFVLQDEDGGSFARFQAKYNMLNVGAGWARYLGTDSAFSAVVAGICGFIRRITARQRAENIGYAEQRMSLNSRFTPTQARDLLDAMLTTYAEYESADFHPRLAVSLSREDPWPDWEVTREAVLGPHGQFLTGIDFCNMEEGHPPKGKREFFESVKDFNRRHPDRAIAILYHVGESFVDKSLESAVRWVHEAAEMGVHRLGHAISLGVNPDRYGWHSRQETAGERMDQLSYDLRHKEGLLRCGVPVDEESVLKELEELRGLPEQHLLTIEYDEDRLNQVRSRQEYAIDCVKALGSVIEVCPTSNRRIGGILQPGDHPVVRFVSSGVPFVVGSDDPGIFDTTLSKEIESAVSIVGLSADAYHEIAERAWSYRSEVLSGRAW